MGVRGVRGPSRIVRLHRGGVEVDATNEAGRSLRDVGTFKVQAGDRVRIVPTAVDIAAGNVLMS